jgi:hypothetical protein
MTHDRDIERLVSHWLDDGPTQIPDRVIGVTADRIGRQRQRPAWRLHWKELSMRPQVLTAATLAAVVILAVGGFVLLRPASNAGLEDSGTESPSATASSSASSPSSGAPSSSAVESANFRPALAVTAPSGWTVDDSDRTFLLTPPAGGPVTGRSIGVMSGPFVTFSDPSCEDQAPAAVGSSVADVVASVVADPRLVATAPRGITIDGQTGQMVDLGVAPGWTGTCDWSGGKGAVLIVSATTTGPAFGVGGTGRDRYAFLDVNGWVVAIDIGTPEGSDFDAFVSEATPIVESLRFK